MGSKNRAITLRYNNGEKNDFSGDQFHIQRTLLRDTSMKFRMFGRKFENVGKTYSSFLAVNFCSKGWKNYQVK